MSDDYEKAGFRTRPRVLDPNSPMAGRITRDERGNAVYVWNDDQLSEDGEAGERARRKALDNPGLAMVEEEERSDAPIQRNTKGLRLGYNPYESGLLPSKTVAKKRDLRELSKWLEMKRRMDGGRD